MLGNCCGVVKDTVVDLNWVEHKYLGCTLSYLQLPLQPSHLPSFCSQGLSLVVSEERA